MARQNKDTSPAVKRFRISIVDDDTHKALWSVKLTRLTFFISALSIVTVVIVFAFSVFAFTPLKTAIPGYPNAHTKRAAIRNALVIDSLESVITKWEFYSENLKNVLLGGEPVSIDSLMKHHTKDTSSTTGPDDLSAKDSLLRQTVKEAEEFSLSQNAGRDLSIEGMHFFPPLRGVLSQKYDKALHPYIDITAPANSVVMSILDGSVINAGWSDKTGYTIAIQHTNDIVSIYMHNEKLLKKTGDKVTAGTPIALVGNTGSLTTGAHLHFELWHKGEAVDPALYMSF